MKLSKAVEEKKIIQKLLNLGFKFKHTQKNLLDEDEATPTTEELIEMLPKWSSPGYRLTISVYGTKNFNWMIFYQNREGDLSYSLKEYEIQQNRSLRDAVLEMIVLMLAMDKIELKK